jgi:hypothetical protein
MQPEAQSTPSNPAPDEAHPGAGRGGTGAERRAAHWTFLTNHAHVLLCIARNPGVRTREIADAVGITDRAAQRIVADLEAAGYLSHQRVGRRNHYQIHGDRPFRHPLERDHAIGELVAVLAKPTGAETRSY